MHQFCCKWASRLKTVWLITESTKVVKDTTSHVLKRYNWSIKLFHAPSTRIHFDRKRYRFQWKRNDCIASSHRFRIVFISFSYRVSDRFRADTRWKRTEKFATSMKTIWKRIRVDGAFASCICLLYGSTKTRHFWTVIIITLQVQKFEVDSRK